MEYLDRMTDVRADTHRQLPLCQQEGGCSVGAVCGEDGRKHFSAFFSVQNIVEGSSGATERVDTPATQLTVLCDQQTRCISRVRL